MISPGGSPLNPSEINSLILHVHMVQFGDTNGMSSVKQRNVILLNVNYNEENDMPKTLALFKKV